MADSSSSNSSPNNPPTEMISPLSLAPNFSQLFKLEGPNYLGWVAQFQPILRANDLEGMVDGTDICPSQFVPNSDGSEQVPNPAYTSWQKRDQHLLSWIICSLSPPLVASMYGLKTSHQAWKSLAERYASQSRSHISQLKRQLQSLQQGNKTCSEYLNTAKQWADQLSAVGKPVEDDDLISFVISGLSPVYNSFVAAFSFHVHDRAMTFANFQAELLSHEVLLQSQEHHTLTPETGNFALYTNKQGSSNFSNQNSSNFRKTRFPPRFNPRSQHFTPRNNSGFSPRNNNGYPFPNQPGHFKNFNHGNPNQQANSSMTTNHTGNTNRTPNPPCQICGKNNHSALDCYHRMDYTYQGRHPPPQLAAMVAQVNADFETQDWLADSGANTHITAEVSNITNPQPFNGTETVGVGNGAGLNIKSFGSSILQCKTPHKSHFLLKDILHCPDASANLLSINKFCLDNNCWFALTGSSFTVKDNMTGEVLLQGPSENGLYPIPMHPKSLNKWKGLAAHLGVKTTDVVWHQRLGHPSVSVFLQLLRDQNLPLSSSVDKTRICESCQLGKSKQLPFCESTRVSTSPLELIHSDVWTSSISSLSGCKYYVLFVDDYSRFTWLYPLINKSDVYQCFVKFTLLVENLFSSKIKQLQTDNGGEYTSALFKQFLSQHGIFHRMTCPHTSQQNGIAERKHRHIMEMGLTLLAQSGLSPKHWVDSFMTAVFLINRLPSPVLKNESPFSKLFKKSPDYTILKTFGCLCYPLLRPYANHKLSFRSKPCIFIGYGGNQRGYRCLDPQTHKVYLSRHVVFNETQFPAKDMSLSQGSCKITASPGNSLVMIPSHLSSTLCVPTEPHQAPQPPSSPPSDQTHTRLNDHSSTESHSVSHPSIPPYHLEQASQSSTPSPHQPSPFTPAPRMITRSQTGHLKPKEFPGFKLFHHIKHPLVVFQANLLPPEPSTYKQAATKPEWRDAMSLEYNALLSNQTWTLCPRPSHHNIVRNKWVFKIKQKPDGSVDRFKARLVAKGFDQLSGIDYYETFSPVVKPATIRLVLALAVQFDWNIKQLDVSNAFLHGILTEEVYMEQPQGFVHPQYPDYVCKLNKALYGLKQAPRAWFTRLSQTLLDIGFIGSQVDPSLFTYHVESIHVYLLVYVDDIILTGNDSETLTTIINKLQADFAMKDLGSLTYFLGIQATRNTAGLHLRQSKYIIDLLDRTQMTHCKPHSAPCSAGSKMSKFDGEPLSNPTEFRHIVGALQYVTLTRPDIAYSVNQLCQHMHAPTSVHLTAAKRVLRYLKGSINLGLQYGKGSLTITSYCDSDWAGNPDDRRSTTGFGIFFGPNLISWSAKKQHVVSRSSTEAEYRSLSLATAEMFWIRMLLKELHISLSSPPTIWCDNLGALALASNPVFHARTKHIEVDVHFVREKVLNRDIQIHHLSTLEQVADIFTKGHTAARFCFLRNKLMVLPPMSLQGGVKSEPEGQPRNYANLTSTACQEIVPQQYIMQQPHTANPAQLETCSPAVHHTAVYTKCSSPTWFPTSTHNSTPCSSTSTHSSTPCSSFSSSLMAAHSAS
jgi:hypothetical protein